MQGLGNWVLSDLGRVHGIGMLFFSTGHLGVVSSVTTHPVVCSLYDLRAFTLIAINFSIKICNLILFSL